MPLHDTAKAIACHNFELGQTEGSKNMCKTMSTNVNEQALERNDWRDRMLNDSTMMAGVTPLKAIKKLYSTNRKMSD